MTTFLAIWGALLSTLLACLALYDRYIKHTGRVRIVIEHRPGYWDLAFAGQVRRLDGESIPLGDNGQPDLSPFDKVFFFQVINTSDSPVEIRFAEIFVKTGFRRNAHALLNPEPLGDKLSGRHDYCVYAVCESNIANAWFYDKKAFFPAKCYFEVQTGTGRKFRSKPFTVAQVFEEYLDNDGTYTQKMLDYSKRSRRPAPPAGPPKATSESADA